MGATGDFGGSLKLKNSHKWLLGSASLRNPSSGRFIGKLDDFRVFSIDLNSAKHSALYNLGFGDMSLTVLADYNGSAQSNPVRANLTFRKFGQDWPVDFNTSRFLMLNAGDPQSADQVQTGPWNSIPPWIRGASALGFWRAQEWIRPAQGANPWNFKSASVVPSSPWIISRHGGNSMKETDRWFMIIWVSSQGLSPDMEALCPVSIPFKPSSEVRFTFHRMHGSQRMLSLIQSRN